MFDVPLIILLGAAAGVFALTVFGLRGFLEIRDALRFAEFARLTPPAHWQATRAWTGVGAAIPVVIAASRLGAGAWFAGLAVARSEQRGLGSVAPQGV